MNESFREQFLEHSLPHSKESETAILGSILIDNNLILQCFEKGLKTDDFYLPFHRKVYQAMTVLFEKNEQINPILIGEEIKKTDSLEYLGGIATITQLAIGLPHFNHIYSYIKIVKEKAIARNLIKVCGNVQSESLAEDADVYSLLDSCEQQIYQLRTDENKNGFVQLKESLQFSLEEKVQRAKHSTDAYTLTGCSTGYRDLNQKLSGLKRTNLIILAGRPGMAKTGLATCIAHNVINEDKEAVVAFFSLEMSKEELTDRFIAQSAKIDLQRYQNGYMIRDEWERATYQVRDELNQSKIFIDDDTGLSVLEIRAKSRHLKLKEKRLDLIIIDYLDLMKSNTKIDKHLAAKEVCVGLKQTAKMLDVPILLLHQLNRDCESRKPPRPILKDLRQSGEEDADTVLLLYREDYYDKNSANKGMAEVIVAKNRNGATGTVKLAFQSEFVRFENYIEY